MGKKLSIKLRLLLIIILVNISNFIPNRYIANAEDNLNIPIPEDYMSDQVISDNEEQVELEVEQNKQVKEDIDNISPTNKVNNETNLDNNKNTELEHIVEDVELEKEILPQNTDNTLVNYKNSSNDFFENFLENESKMLLIPDDDIVLGKITKDGLFEVMSDNTYAKVIFSDLKNLKKRTKASKLNFYIENYDKNYHKISINNLTQNIKLNISELFTIAKNNIIKNDLRLLQKLIHASNKLMYFRDIHGYGLLDYALSQERYIIVKWLILNKYPIANSDKNLLTAISSLSYKMNDYYNMKYYLDNIVQ